MSSHASGLSRASRNSSRQSLDTYDDDRPRKRNPMKEHPYEKFFGKRVTKHLDDYKHPDEITLSWKEYKCTEWPNLFPDFIGDLIHYLSGFDIIQFLQDKKSKELEEKL